MKKQALQMKCLLSLSKKVIHNVEVYQFALHQRLPCEKGKRSAVAGVNDSPVGCQSRDRACRSKLSPLCGD